MFVTDEGIGDYRVVREKSQDAQKAQIIVAPVLSETNVQYGIGREVGIYIVDTKNRQ